MSSFLAAIGAVVLIALIYLGAVRTVEHFTKKGEN